MGKIKLHKVGLAVILLAVLLTLVSGCLWKTNLPEGWLHIKPQDAVQSIIIQDDTVWTGCKDGVYRIDRRTGVIIEKLAIEPALSYVKSLALDKDGALYIGHFHGLTIYKNNDYVTLTTADGLPDDRVNALLFDSEGKLWVGTWGGLGILTDGKWQVLTAADGLINDMVNVILQDREGDMWFGSYVAPAGGISYYRNGDWQTFSNDNGLPHNNVTSLYEDNSGNIWAGTGLLDRGGAVEFVITGGVAAINRVLKEDDGLVADKVRSVFQDRDGTMWFGSEYDGLTRYSHGNWRILTKNDGLSDLEITCIVQDVDGNIWLGTTNGVTRLTYGAVQALP